MSWKRESAAIHPNYVVSDSIETDAVSKQLNTLPRPFVLVPGKIGLPVVSEIAPAIFELRAPSWWLDAVSAETRSWEAVLCSRGNIRRIEHARTIPSARSDVNNTARVALVDEGALRELSHQPRRSPLDETTDSCGPPNRIEIVTDANAIHRVFNAAYHLGFQCILHGDKQQVAIIQKFSDRLTLSIHGSRTGGWSWAELQTPCAAFRFPLEVCERTAHFELALPTYLIRIQRRNYLRVLAPQGLELCLDFGGQLCRVPLLDISARGVRIPYDCGLPSAVTGLTFPCASIENRRNLVWKGSLQVSHADESQGIGACLSVPDSETINRWYNLVDELLHTRSVSGARHAEAAWKTFVRSGYFNLSGKEPSDFEVLRTEFTEVNHKLDNKRHLGALIYTDDHVGVSASISAAKYFSKSWLVHQVAKFDESKITSNSLGALRDIYLHAYEMCMRDPTNLWTVIYTEGHVSWHVRSHFAFAEANPEAVTVVPIRLLEFSTHRGTTWKAHPEPSVEFATGTECELLETLATTMPLPYREALDLTARTLDTKAITETYAEAEIQRERQIFVARRDRKVVAWLIADRCTPTPNLFRLFDSIRLVSASDDGPDYYPPLIDAAREWYRSAGKEAFVCIYEGVDCSCGNLRDAKDLGVGHMWICAANRVMEFMEHVVEITSPLAPDRRDQRPLARVG